MINLRVFGRLPLLAALCVVALSGCDSMPVRDPAFAATLPPMPHKPKNDGAIYQPGTSVPLFQDIRAHRVGDLITIHLAESTNASKKAATDTKRKNDTTVDNPTILGTNPAFALPGALPLAGTSSASLKTSLSSQNDFAGSGDSSQSNSLTGDITVTVDQVLPNGYLMVRGEKRVELNQGNEYVKISGIIRPADIASDNSVLSTQVADATIIYDGDGQLADANRQGWLARFFNSKYFPF